jgi:hypothetical protein
MTPHLVIDNSSSSSSSSSRKPEDANDGTDQATDATATAAELLSSRPAKPSPDDDDDDGDTGVRMSVETHLLTQDLEEDWSDDEGSLRSWRSLRSWKRRRNCRRVEVYVDIQAPDEVPVEGEQKGEPKARRDGRPRSLESPSRRRATPTNARSSAALDPTVHLSDMLARVGSATERSPSPPADPDASSVQSQTLFTQDDFSSSLWLNALTANSAYISVAAVIALTISMAHPILFGAAALTALGTATAVSASYDYWTEGPLAACCRPSDVDDRLLASVDAPTSLPDAASSTMTGIASDDTRISGTATPIFPALPTLGEGSTEEASPRMMPSSPTSRTLLQTHHFPPLDVSVMKTSLEGLHAPQFFAVFFADAAPYNFQAFQLQRGDKNVRYGLWRNVVTTAGDAQPPQSLSLHPAAATGPAAPPASSFQSWQERELHFQAKTNNALLGPPYATTRKHQRILVVSKKLAVLEMKTTLADIPFCDRFFVLERWWLQAAKDASGVYHLQIEATAAVMFTKSCPFASPIRTKTARSLQDVAKSWCHMARQALVLTKQAKQDRLLLSQQQDDDDDVLEQDHGDEVQEALVPNDEPVSKAQPVAMIPSPASDDTGCSPPRPGEMEEVAEEKKEESALHDENVELVHSFAREASWVMGEEANPQNVRAEKGPARFHKNLRRRSQSLLRSPKRQSLPHGSPKKSMRRNNSLLPSPPPQPLLHRESP